VQAVLVYTPCHQCGRKNRLIISERVASTPTCGACRAPLFEKFQVVRGYVYILSNPAMPGLLKIGHTTGRLATRVTQLSSSTGVPKPFAVEASFYAEHPKEEEARVHEALRHFRAPGREFFSLSTRDAIRCCEEVLGKKPHHVGSRDGEFRDP